MSQNFTPSRTLKSALNLHYDYDLIICGPETFYTDIFNICLTTKIKLHSSASITGLTSYKPMSSITLFLQSVMSSTNHTASPLDAG